MRNVESHLSLHSCFINQSLRISYQATHGTPYNEGEETRRRFRDYLPHTFPQTPRVPPVEAPSQGGNGFTQEQVQNHSHLKSEPVKEATFEAFRENPANRNTTYVEGNPFLPLQREKGWLGECGWSPHRESCSRQSRALSQQTEGAPEGSNFPLPSPSSSATGVFWRAPALQGNIFGNEPVAGPSRHRRLLEQGIRPTLELREKLAQSQASRSSSLPSQS